MLCKYIAYARQAVKPRLPKLQAHAVEDKISHLYAHLREEVGQGVIQVRLLESVIRMSEASARIHCRHFIVEDDVNIAIRTCLESIISTQKHSEQRRLRKVFLNYLSSKTDIIPLALVLLRSLVREAKRYAALNGHDCAKGVPISLPRFEYQAKWDYNITDLAPFYNSQQFKENEFTLDRVNKVILFKVVSHEESRASESDTEFDANMAKTLSTSNDAEAGPSRSQDAPTAAGVLPTTEGSLPGGDTREQRELEMALCASQPRNPS